MDSNLETCSCPMDCFDLEDWIIKNAPDVYAATRYLHWSIAVDCWHKCYHARLVETRFE